MSGINVSPSEWGDWARYYGELFPTAPGEVIDAMAKRMIRTLSFCGVVSKMTPTEYLGRVRQFRDSIKALPPDSNNKLMSGGA